VGSPIRLGIVDVDRPLVAALRKRLANLGWPHRVMASPVPPEALVPMRLDALVLDLAVLGPPGWSYLEEVCARLPDLGVVVCTGQSTVAQRVRALRLGADDWLAKPCHPEELIARVEAVVRRRQRADVRDAEPVLRSGDLELHRGQLRASTAGGALELTRREYEVLQLLVTAHGQVLRREDIYARVWGFAMVGGDRSVDVYVRKIRQKLERASPEWRYIHTHFGVGYRFAPEPVGAEPAVPAAPVH
jgi:DNA-binding response OmpR family regulator